MRFNCRPAWLLTLILLLFGGFATAQEGKDSADELSPADLGCRQNGSEAAGGDHRQGVWRGGSHLWQRSGGGGSGVLYDPAGFALTNHHVVAAAGRKVGRAWPTASSIAGN